MFAEKSFGALTQTAQNEEVIVHTTTQHTELFLREFFFYNINKHICYSFQLVKLDAWI